MPQLINPQIKAKWAFEIYQGLYLKQKIELNNTTTYINI